VIKNTVIEGARGFGPLNEPVWRTEFFINSSEEELSELGGMKTNAAQYALTDTTMNFCKKERGFRTRGFLFF